MAKNDKSKIAADEATTMGHSQRDQLVVDLHAVYTGAPSMNYKAYIEAQRALKVLEDMTFSDDEIDAFLPKARSHNYITFLNK